MGIGEACLLKSNMVQATPDTVPIPPLFSLAQRHLPRELLQELRMPVPQPAKRRRAKPSHGGGDEEKTGMT